MSGRTCCNSIPRLIPRRLTSTSPQHTSSPFRSSPSVNNTSTSTLNSSCTQYQTATTTISRRAISSNLRSQTKYATIRDALSCEISSLRYVLLLESDGEEALLRGWDAGVAVEDEDGTWVICVSYFDVWPAIFSMFLMFHLTLILCSLRPLSVN